MIKKTASNKENLVRADLLPYAASVRVYDSSMIDKKGLENLIRDWATRGGCPHLSQDEPLDAEEFIIEAISMCMPDDDNRIMVFDKKHGDPLFHVDINDSRVNIETLDHIIYGWCRGKYPGLIDSTCTYDRREDNDYGD